jgi:hypothetical protein
MLVMSNLRMKGCWMPGGSTFKICATRCCTSNCALSRLVPKLNQMLTSETPCFDELSTRSTPGEADTARSIGWVIVFSMSAGPAPL